MCAAQIVQQSHVDVIGCFSTGVVSFRTVKGMWTMTHTYMEVANWRVFIGRGDPRYGEFHHVGSVAQSVMHCGRVWCNNFPSHGRTRRGKSQDERNKIRSEIGTGDKIKLAVQCSSLILAHLF